MDSAAIVYSPYNWVVSASSAKTINPGAYFRLLFTGNATLLTNSSAAAVLPSQVWTRVDGGPLVQHTLPRGPGSIAVPLGPPYSATDHHLAEVIVKSSTETEDRWLQQTTAAVFTGIIADAVSAPVRRPLNVLIYGDSITEGVRTLGYEGIAADTDRNDAVRDYSYQLSQLLPVEVGVVAFGATGVTKGGSGSVPALPASYDHQWQGEPRSFEPAPDLIVYNEGTNDRTQGAPFVSALGGVVAALRRAAPAARQLILLPFNGCHQDDLLAVVHGAADANVKFGNTSGWYDGSDGLHPFGYQHMGNIAPRLAQLSLPMLEK